MANHPGRGGNKRCAQPTPANIVAMRSKHGLTQGEAAQMVCANERTWQKWEGGERAMRASDWQLFLIRLGEEPPT